MTSTEEHVRSAEREATLRRALLEVRAAREAADRAVAATAGPIAVVGIGCRFPGGVSSADDLWELLTAGRHGVVETPPDRWDLDRFYDSDPDVPGRTYSRHGGFLDDVKQFDAGLFGISPREAVSIDPQHRLVLEVAWTALEHAGIAPDSLRGTRTGVFVGMGGGDYERLGSAAHGVTSIDAYVATGNAGNFGANRLSYALGLEGPSMVVDTACSSSLVALHLAVQSLRAGECETALVGGVNTLLSPEVTVALSKGRMLSPTGQCRTFDAGADGYVRGEGCGVVVLQSLSAARAAGHEVLCVIKGSAVNQDGRTSGLTVPRSSAQREVIRQALAAAHTAPADIGYLEAHGTGTPLGDPIEVRAVAAVLGVNRPADRPVRLGSVKTNLGHLEAAAGIAGFIKAALVVAHGQIPPHLHLREPNPHVDWSQLPVQVPTENTAWGPGPRLAGVSSFGFGGTNAHVVLGEAPEAPVSPTPAAVTDAAPVIVKVSGATAAARAAAAAGLADAVDRHPEWSPAEIAWAAGTGRADLAHRGAVVAADLPGLTEGLRDIATGSGLTGRRVPGAIPRVAMIAPGHGARIAGTLAGIYGVVPAVTEVIDELGGADALPLSVLIDGGPESQDALSRTEIAQPALYALSVSLGRWWQSIGVEPEVLLGHSVGAYAAAALAGVFSVADGATLIRTRGQAMSELAEDGAMAAISCTAAELADLPELRAATVTVAVTNGPTDTVVSGSVVGVESVMTTMSGRGVRVKRLPVQHGFHSALVEPMLDTLHKAFDDITLSPPVLDLISDTTGAVVCEEVTDPGYWVEHTRNTVQFGDALDTLLGRGITAVVELGPGALLSLVLHHIAAAAVDAVATVAAEDPAAAQAMAVARLWVAGADISWQATHPRPQHRRQLPTYPFERTEYWIPTATIVTESVAAPVVPVAAGALAPLVQRTATGGSVVTTQLDAASIPFLDEHVVHGVRVVPGVVLLELALRAGEAASTEALLVDTVAIMHPLVAPDDVRIELQVLCGAFEEGLATAEIYSTTSEFAEWTKHAEVRLRVRSDDDGDPIEPGEVFLEEPVAVDSAEFYERIWHPKFSLGPSFRVVEHAQIGAGAALGTIGRPSPTAGSEIAGVRTELVAFDACVQLVAAAWTHEHGTDPERPLMLGTGFENMRVLTDFDGELLRCAVELTESTPMSATGDITLYAGDRPAVIFTGVGFAPVTSAMLARLVQAGRYGGHGSARLAAVAAPDLAALRTAPTTAAHATVLGYTVSVLAAVLGREEADIDTFALFSELIDSLMIAEIKRKIEQDLEIGVPLEALFDHPTPRRLCDWIVGEIAGEAAESVAGAPQRSKTGVRIRRKTVEEMTELATLDADITPVGVPLDGRTDVLLTGATGFVGAFLLRELLDTGVRVHCPVRADDVDHARRRLTENMAGYGMDCTSADSERIVPIVADLGKPLCGLTPQDYSRLATEIGQIVHAGALVKWTYPYRGLEDVNIGGTRELLRLATWAAPIPFHFLSTVGVFSSREYLRDSVTEGEPLENSGALVVGYAQTKWISERMVRFAAERGLPVTVHRINTAGHSTTGAFNKLDHLSMLVKGCIEAGVAPKRGEMPIQPAPVDYVARAIVACTRHPELYGGTYHLVGDREMPWPEFFDTIAEFGYPLQRLPFEQWRERILRRGSTSMALMGLMPFLSDSVDHVRLPLSQSEATVAAMRAADVDCPSLTRTQIETYLRRFVSSGFIRPPADSAAHREDRA
ncbi:thioester reductase domain-containing protein [Nocardia salmonicida]|uniref:thioester reductase domain-containing protein n=1 Tax=Nocardia salmonicida TaxID=53431 RepID=UPI0033F02B60